MTGLNPPFRARLGQTIPVTELASRSVTSIQNFPTSDNDQTLAARIDDDFGGADWYEISISWQVSLAGFNRLRHQPGRHAGSTAA